MSRVFQVRARFELQVGRRAQNLVAVVPTQGAHYVVTLFIVHVIEWNNLHVDIMICSFFHVSLYA